MEPQVIGEPPGFQLVAEVVPALRGHHQEVVPGAAHDGPVDRIRDGQPPGGCRLRLKRRTDVPGHDLQQHAAELDLVAGLEPAGLAGEQPLAIHERPARRVEVADDDVRPVQLERRLPRGHSPRRRALLVAQVEPGRTVQGVAQYDLAAGEREHLPDVAPAARPRATIRSNGFESRAWDSWWSVRNTRSQVTLNAA